jgi:ANTAR domain
MSRLVAPAKSYLFGEIGHMSLDAVVRRQSTRITIINGPQPALAQASEGPFDLERAVQSNREIGVAMGILMAREMCTQSQAFNRLRTASQQLNRKLRDIADDVKRTGQLPVRAPFRQRRRTA